jgi:peptidoglycan/LPS O-acetylase OafA/YrhL
MKRNLQIDFLRFCGVFLVMINHLIILGNSSLDVVLGVIKTGGWIGVDLFFVLSGYLVSGLIINEYQIHQSFSPQRFLIRRGFKIYPSYYLFLGVSYIFFTYLTKEPQSISSLFHESIFVSNYFSFNNQHTWSISVEEHFYFLLAILFFLMIKYDRISLRNIIVTYIIVFIIGFLCRLNNYITYGTYDFGRDYVKSHLRFDALFLGVVLSYISSYRNDIIEGILSHKSRIVLLIFSVGFIATNFILKREENPWISVVNLSINPICFGFILINCISYKSNSFLKVISPLSYIGKYSYSIYLFHTIFMAMSIHLFKSGGIKYYISYIVFAIIGGVIISKLIEYPLISFREKHFPSKSRDKKELPQQV